MKKALVGLFIFGFLFIGTPRVQASVLSDALLQIKNLKNEIIQLKTKLGASALDAVAPSPLPQIISIGNDQDFVYSPGSEISLKIKTTDGIDSPAYKSNGYNIQAYVFPASDPNFYDEYLAPNPTYSYNGAYDESSGYWNVKMNAPLNPGSYNLKVTLYCSIPSLGLCNSTTFEDTKVLPFKVTSSTTTPTTDLTPRISYWSGKVNQHVDIASRTWQTDSDGVSGANLDKLTYCKKFYPNTTSVVEYKNETINSWHDAGNLSNYTSTKMSYKCVEKENICIDSDGGLNGNVAGNVNFNNYKVYDSCNDSSTVSEAICNDDMLEWWPVSCPNGCSNGACIQSIVTPSITVLSPNGGENYQAGKQIEVKWKTENIQANASVYILLEQGGMNQVNSLNDGSEIITLPTSFSTATFGKNFRILVGQVGLPISDISDNTFTITSPASTPSITVLSPNGGEVYQSGQQITVKWKTYSMPNARINIELLNANNVAIYDMTDLTDDGQEIFKLPNTAGGQYHFQINTKNYGNVSDVSDNTFTINPATITTPSITVLSPNGGEKYTAGQQINVKWKSTGLVANSLINISIENPSDSSALQLTQNYTINDGVELIALPTNINWPGIIYGNNFKINVHAVGSSNNLLDMSDSTFTIESLCTDSDGGINLEVAGFTDGRVNGIGASFKDSSVGLNGGSCSGSNCTGVAEGYCENGQVTNHVYQCPSKYSVNGACKASISTPSITVLSPNGGETYALGKTINIKWNSNYIDSQDLVYINIGIKDSQAVAELLYNMKVANTGSYNFTIPINYNLDGHSSNKYEVSVGYLGNSESVDDHSDSSFTITSSPDNGCSDGRIYSSTTGQICPSNLITLLSPQTGSTFKAGQTVKATWSTRNFPEYTYIDVIIKKDGNVIKQTSTINDGQESIKIPLNTPAGKYDVSFGIQYHQSSGGSGTNYFDKYGTGTFYVTSDSNGCSNGEVYSSTTGQMCPRTPSVSVLSPNGGDILTQKTPHRILWSDSTPPLYNYGGTSFFYYDLTLEDANYPACGGSMLCPTVMPMSYTIANKLKFAQGGTKPYFDWTVGKATNGTIIYVPDGSYKVKVCKSGTTDCDYSDSYFKITSGTSTGPVISGVSGPQSLNVNQTGTWKVVASSSTGGNLSYSVNWGDEAYKMSLTSAFQNTLNTQQSATFTHSYIQAGTYTPTFTVTSENTIRCVTTPCPSNGGSATTSLSVKVGSSSIYPAGCSSTEGYSPITGVKCDGSQGNIDGCLPEYIFSPITGTRCPPVPTGEADQGASVTVTNPSTINTTSSNIGTSTSIRRTLRPGVKGEDVKWLQEFLNLAADGSFGPETQAKVMEWQAANGLRVDGLFGTQSALKAGLVE